MNEMRAPSPGGARAMARARMSLQICERGPALGGVCLGKPTDSSQTAVVRDCRRGVPSLLSVVG